MLKRKIFWTKKNLDFEKAFDSLNHHYLFKCLKKVIKKTCVKGHKVHQTYFADNGTFYQ